MEKIAQYRQYIQNVLQTYACHPVSQEGLEVQLGCDIERDHYYVFNVGWEKNHRNYGCVLHVDIKDNKIWIQHDGTEIGIANELVNLGVPKEDIVLAFHSPYRRQFTGFAIK